MPLQRRVPKFGFRSPNRVELKPINLDRLQLLIDKTNAKSIDIELLVENGLIKPKDKVKILGKGELKSKVEVAAHFFSKSASEAIEKLGGKVIQAG